MPAGSERGPQASPENANAEDPSSPARYARIRAATESLCEPLSAEDCSAQSMPDASPAKWHLAHTTWFFETLVLEPRMAGFQPLHPGYRVLFNSYYNSIGEQYSRPRRGMLTRPSLDEVLAYRAHTDERVARLLETETDPELTRLVELGLQHEQQHQELILTDVKHLLSLNPLNPAYREIPEGERGEPKPLTWIHHAGGVQWIGHTGEGFCFDNETPRHRELVEPFELASRLVTNAEVLAFIGDGGYERPELWLSDGWALVQREGWRSPLYWQRRSGEWLTQTLGGLQRAEPSEPVCHLSYYEADAYARWAAARLPTESEWEVAAASQPIAGNFVESGRLHPAPVRRGDGIDGPAQLFGDLWEWTQSAYAAYPGYRPPQGAVGEYNGKFMCSQLVLRGGSCATPRSHVRASYRNFFYPDARWQFTGVRLARDAG